MSHVSPPCDDHLMSTPEKTIITCPSAILLPLSSPPLPAISPHAPCCVSAASSAHWSRSRTQTPDPQASYQLGQRETLAVCRTRKREREREERGERERERGGGGEKGVRWLGGEGSSPGRPGSSGRC